MWWLRLALGFAIPRANIYHKGADPGELVGSLFSAPTCLGGPWMDPKADGDRGPTPLLPTTASNLLVR